jgi:hypothetical protein
VLLDRHRHIATLRRYVCGVSELREEEKTGM